MKPLRLTLFAVALVGSVALASDVRIKQTYQGSGTPSNALQVENAFEVVPGVYHAPQHMPNWPTAATLWSRVIDIECDDPKSCPPYNYSPSYGRAEYLFFRPTKPKAIPAPPPAVVTCSPTVVERVVLQEVACKKKDQ